MDKQINLVYSSSDYEKFSFFEENRDIDPSKVTALEESMETESLEKPIDVNEYFKIIDGQHRFCAWRNRKEPIIYIIHKGWGAKEIPVLNTNQKNWIPSDFLGYYLAAGNKDYEVYKHFSDHYGFTHGVNLMLLTGRTDGKSINNLFDCGKFKATKLNQANEIAKQLHGIREYYPGYKRRGFVGAFCKLRTLSNYNHDQLIDKLKYQSRKLVDCTTVDEYFDLIKEIYNYKTRNNENRI